MANDKYKSNPIAGRNYFDSWEPDKFNKDARYQATIREFTSGLVLGDVLDVGCGSRVFYRTDSLKSWTGVDLSYRMIQGIHFEGARRKFDTRFCQADLTNLPFQNNSFDTVCAIFLLHHLGARNRPTSLRRVGLALQSLREVLRPDGKLIVAENAAGPLEWAYHAAYPVAYPVVKRLFNIRLPFFLTLNQFRSVAFQAGFSDLVFVNIKIEDYIYNPVLKMRLPPFFSSDLIQKMTLYLLFP